MDELREAARRRNDHRDGKHRDRPDQGCDTCNPWDDDQDEDRTPTDHDNEKENTMSKPEQELRDAQRAADNNMRRNSGRDQASHERRVDVAAKEAKRR